MPDHIKHIRVWFVHFCPPAMLSVSCFSWRYRSRLLNCWSWVSLMPLELRHMSPWSPTKVPSPPRQLCPVASQRPHISSLFSSTLIDGCVLSAKDPYLLYTTITRHTWPRHLTISLSESIENCLRVAILGSKCMHFIVNNLHTRIIYNYTHHTKNRIKNSV